jgi:hypothetical protein
MARPTRREFLAAVPAAGLLHAPAQPPAPTLPAIRTRALNHMTLQTARRVCR